MNEKSEIFRIRIFSICVDVFRNEVTGASFHYLSYHQHRNDEHR